ncbi:MAG TPA: FAD-binding oxidoreductase [Gammaproteobacteria bacterium]|nr:FAD-binding oxidoreductase [Gammaproteobacteria bacterium]HIK68679.1 FAD-binding oxidoreductase [Pseudomonadales bacterium]
MPTRRTLLQAMSVLPMVAGCGLSTGNARHYTPSGLPLRRVNVSQQRVIRTVAGLRPFRSSGFRVEAESVDSRLLIHNYGHGGGGITLSWGTSHLAMEIAMQSQHRRCAVLGCGAVGLASARLMQDRGWDVTIYAKDLPPETTSNIAGGQWSPTSVYDDEFVTPEFSMQFEAAMRHSYRYFQNLVGQKYGVRWISNYRIKGEGYEDDGFTRSHIDMYPQHQTLAAGEHPFAVPEVLHYNTMLIEPAVYLPAVMRDFHIAGGVIKVREFIDRADVLTLEEPVIINCTGLGARDLFDDRDLFPIKGQLTFLLPQSEVNYITLGRRGLYMFPRSDGILLGGTFERDQWSLTPDPVETRRIVEGHRNFFSAMEDPWA